MQCIQEKFEDYVQTQQYAKADSIVEALCSTNIIRDLERETALKLLYRLGYVYPESTLQLCHQRKDIPRPFIDTLKIALGDIPPLRFYSYADALVAIKIALLRKNSFFAKILINRFYRQYGLLPIKLIRDNRVTVGNNDNKIRKERNGHRVSVIVTTYNSENFIANCIESLLNQTIDNVEIIVVDDASSDNTLNILKKYPEIKIIALDINRGTYHARNIGIKNAKGDFITFQDSDDWSHPERLTYQLSQLLSEKKVIANFSNFFRVNEETGLPVCRQNYPLLRLNLSSMMIRKKYLEEVSGFDDSKRVESDKKLLKKLEGFYPDKYIKYIKLPLAIGLFRNNSLTTSDNSGFNSYGYSKNRNLI